MKKLFFLVLTLFLFSCAKDEEVFISPLANSTYFVIKSEKCSDLIMSYLVTNINGINYRLNIDSKNKTYPISLINGTYVISDFRVFSDNNTTDDILISNIPDLSSKNLYIFSVDTINQVINVDVKCVKNRMKYGI